MKMHRVLLIVYILFFFSSCDQKTSKSEITAVIFGRFCGQCKGECATMYKLDIPKNKLFVDHSDSYWKYDSTMPIIFADSITDDAKLRAVDNFIDKIPVSLLSNSKPEEQFGCPDCADGCGIFVEFLQDKKRKKVILDYQTESLSGETKTFAEDIKEIIKKLETGGR